MAAVDPARRGARVPVVRWNGRVYEAVQARCRRREPRDLFHAALEVRVEGVPYVVEMTPAWGAAHSPEGAVASGPVGLRCLGRSRFFRYEVHCWRDGVIPDRAFAVGGTQLLTTDAAKAQLLLDSAPVFPTAVWGRDERRVGDMWNSNSLVAWLLARSGIPTADLGPPHNGRAPGWAAGIAAATSVAR